jgi:glycosyltransferase involved in cell wall biosynthesis
VSERPRISLVIATYNWPRALELVLESVRAQRVPPLEVVIADDGSRDETWALIERMRPHLPVPLVHVWHEDTGFRLAAIRNKAIAAAQGDYVVQIDGDIVLHPSFIDAHAQFARRGGWVQGSRALLERPVTERLLAGESIRLWPFTPHLRMRQNALYAPWLTAVVRGPADGLKRIRGAHMAFWRDDLLRVNGYDESIEGWGREDSELATRLINAGLVRRNLKFSAVCYHLWHKQASADAVERNHEVFLRTLRERRTRCERGVDQYLSSSPRVA